MVIMTGTDQNTGRIAVCNVIVLQSDSDAGEDDYQRAEDELEHSICHQLASRFWQQCHYDVSSSTGVISDIEIFHACRKVCLYLLLRWSVRWRGSIHLDVIT